MNDYCGLARRSLAEFLTSSRRLRDICPLGQRAGCFVSYHRRSGELRGCIGTIEPSRKDLSDEIVENAISAGVRDPRFPPITLDELPDLVVNVSVMQSPEIVHGPQDLDPARYGVIVESGPRRGVLLPGLEGIDTVAKQLAVVRRKAGIDQPDPVVLKRFEVEAHHEPRP